MTSQLIGWRVLEERLSLTIIRGKDKFQIVGSGVTVGEIVGVIVAVLVGVSVAV